MPTVYVTEYDPNWPALFESLCERIWPAIAEHALCIEHVGSTSVPGLVAKPIIDMTIVLRDRDEMPALIKKLARLDYRHRGDLGVPGREAFHHPKELPRHHLYACVEGALALRNHLAVRDLLRADPNAVRAYGELKQSLAHKHPDDIDAYTDAKTPVLLGLLERAGIGKEELAEINRINNGPPRSA